MKCIKSLGLLAAAAAALMALAGTASATSLTSSSGTTPAIAATAGATSFDGAFSTVTCQKSEISGSITGHGAGVTASGPISTMHFKECNFPWTIEITGTWAIHPATPTGNGRVTFTGLKISIHTSVGTCVFTTNSTEIGTLTGSNNTGGKATIDLTGKIPRTGGNFLCGSSATWTGSYTINSPASLEVH